MISFHVPLSMKEEGGGVKEFFSFPLQKGSTVCFAGSRNQTVSSQVCRDLVSGFGRLGFSFIIGCANGVDASFRSALAESEYKDKSFVACCYSYRVPKISGLSCGLVVPEEVHPRSAPRVRTLYMVDRCDLAVVFADDPKSDTWGKGSTVCINACIKQGKPVFVVNEDIKSRVTYSVIMPKLNPDSIREFILSQLDKVTLAHNIFTDDALELVIRSSDGILRRVRNLSLSCMLEAVRARKRSIDLDIVNSVLIQPHWRQENDIEYL